MAGRNARFLRSIWPYVYMRLMSNVDKQIRTKSFVPEGGETTIPTLADAGSIDGERRAGEHPPPVRPNQRPNDHALSAPALHDGRIRPDFEDDRSFFLRDRPIRRTAAPQNQRRCPENHHRSLPQHDNHLRMKGYVRGASDVSARCHPFVTEL